MSSLARLRLSRWGSRTSGRLRQLGVQALRLLPIGTCQRLVPRPIVGFCYHVVSDRPLAHVRHLFRYKSPRQFERDLDYLEQRFDIVSYRDLLEARPTGRPARRPCALLSFDDGMSECYSIVRPILLKRKLPAIFFVSPSTLDNRELFPFSKASLSLEALTGLKGDAATAALRRLETVAGTPFADVVAFRRWILRWVRTIRPDEDQVLDAFCELLGVDLAGYLATARPYMTTAELRSLAADGFTAGAHGMRHTLLGALPLREQFEREIVLSSRVIMELAASARVPFAFPFDSGGIDRSWLLDIAVRHPEIGPFFDSCRLLQDGELIVNRVIADRPPAVWRDRTNVPGLLRDAYLDEFMRPFRRRAGRPPRVTSGARPPQRSDA